MSPGLNKLLWSMLAKLQGVGLSKDDAETVLREHVKAVSGQHSTKLLTDEQARWVIRELSRRLTRPVEGPAIITPAQQSMLGELQEALHLDARAYRGMSMRVVKRPWPQTREEAEKVLEALKAMFQRTFTATVLQACVTHVSRHVGVSVEDRRFVTSLCSGRLSLSQSLILLKIGRRYGVPTTARLESDGGSGGDRAESGNGPALPEGQVADGI